MSLTLCFLLLFVITQFDLSLGSYTFFVSPFYYWSANDFCTDYCSSKLVSIHSDTENDRVKEVIQNEPIDILNPVDFYGLAPYYNSGCDEPQCINVNEVWIGIHRDPPDGGDMDLFWIDTTPLDYGQTQYSLPWHPEDPNHDGNCVHMWPRSSFYWNDYWCENNMRFMCNSCVGKLNKYVHFKENKNYAAAKDWCSQTLGTDLASIHSLSDYQEAYQWCTKNDDSCWIGMNDQAEEGTFVWDDGTTLDYGSSMNGIFPWSDEVENEPNFGDNENCVEMRKWNNFNWEWNDQDCTQYLDFLCNKPSELCYNSEWNFQDSLTWNGCEINSVLKSNSIINSKKWLYDDSIWLMDYLFTVSSISTSGEAGVLIYHFDTICDYYYVGVSIDGSNNAKLFIYKYINDVKQQIYLSGTLFTYSFNTYYTLRVQLTYNEGSYIQWDVSMNEQSIMFQDSSSNSYITHSKFVGLKNNDATINAKSLYISDTPTWTFSDNLSFTCTAEPTTDPTNYPTNAPSVAPSLAPTQQPSIAPSSVPTQPPSLAPSIAPTQPPSIAPSISPTQPPSISPTQPPSFAPSTAPSLSPTQPPSLAPSLSPTQPPSLAPSIAPSQIPTQPPSLSPTLTPTQPPSLYPTQPPSLSPTAPPSLAPSIAPSQMPTQPPSIAPSVAPTPAPTNYPSIPPTKNPTTPSPTDPGTLTCGDEEIGDFNNKAITFEVVTMYYGDLTFDATNSDFNITVLTATDEDNTFTESDTDNDDILTLYNIPTGIYNITMDAPHGITGTFDLKIICQSDSPTPAPTTNPTPAPTDNPTNQPTYEPTYEPTIIPTFQPTSIPTIIPTNQPTYEPTFQPTNNPTNQPTYEPTLIPTIIPTFQPTLIPTIIPTFEPTLIPTKFPSFEPTVNPTSFPSITPSKFPSKYPSKNPSKYPSKNPSVLPTVSPVIITSNVDENDSEYTITIDSSTDLNKKDVEEIVEDSLGITDGDVKSTKNKDGSITLIVRISNDISLDEDIIKGKIEEGLAEEYPEIEIDVEVEKNDKATVSNKGFLNKLMSDMTTFILIISTILLIIIVCILVICLMKRSKEKKKSAKNHENLAANGGDINANGEGQDNNYTIPGTRTTITGTGPGTTTIEMETITTPLTKPVKEQQQLDNQYILETPNSPPNVIVPQHNYDSMENTGDLPSDNDETDEENEQMYMDENDNNKHVTAGGDNNDNNNDNNQFDGVLVTPGLKSKYQSTTL